MPVKQSIPIPTSVQPLATTILLLVSMDLPILAISYKHMTFYVWQLSLSIMLSLSIVFSGFIHVISLLHIHYMDYIPLYEYESFSMAIGNSAVMKICVRVFVWVHVFNYFRYLGVEFLSDMLIVFLTFWVFQTVSWQLYHFTFLPAMYKDSSFPLPYQHFQLCIWSGILLCFWFAFP